MLQGNSAKCRAEINPASLPYLVDISLPKDTGNVELSRVGTEVSASHFQVDLELLLTGSSPEVQHCP